MAELEVVSARRCLYTVGFDDGVTKQKGDAIMKVGMAW